MWLNGVLVFAAFGSVALAASVSFDRLTPALGAQPDVHPGLVLPPVLGSLWTAARGLQP